jgi:fermentation-respiration switch protein FrsA (DUF1100 family)
LKTLSSAWYVPCQPAALCETDFFFVSSPLQRKLIPSVMPYLRMATMLCHQIWDSEESMKRIASTPVIFLSGRADELIPPRHMDGLNLACTSSIKEFVSFENGSHNDTCMQRGYFDAIIAFWKRHVA